MTSKLVQATSLQKGSYVIIGGAACRVVDVQISRPGKHGHAKVRLSAIGLIDDKKRIEVMPGHDNVEVPIIEKRTAQVLSVKDDVATVMDMETYESFELKIPPELKSSVTDGASVLYWIILNERVMKQLRGAGESGE